MAQLARLSMDRCCPWGTVRDRRYGHAEVTAGEDDAGSGRAATVTSLTGGEARRLGHTYVGTEHLLLVLIRDRNGGATAVLRQLGVSADAVEEALWPCVAAGLPRIDPDALATLGIDFEAVRERLEEKFGPGALEHTHSGCLGVTPGSVKVAIRPIRPRPTSRASATWRR